MNSNMRRHLRNHTSPSTRSNSLTPYTYPLTTCPRNYNFNNSSITASRSPSSSVSSSPRVPRHVHLTDSEEDSDPTPDASRYWEADSDLEEANGRLTRLRLRSRSSPGARRSPPMSGNRSPQSLSVLLGLQRARSSSCAHAGSQYGLPVVLHPSELHRHLRK